MKRRLLAATAGIAMLVAVPGTVGAAGFCSPRWCPVHTAVHITPVAVEAPSVPAPVYVAPVPVELPTTIAPEPPPFTFPPPTCPQISPMGLVEPCIGPNGFPLG